MQLQYKNIILRDTVERDLEDYIRWNTTETEWQNWDAPWENDSTVPLSEQIASAKRQVDPYILAAENNVVRKSFEICTGDGTHIGWINRYYYLFYSIGVKSNRKRALKAYRKRIGEKGYGTLRSGICKGEGSILSRP